MKPTVPTFDEPTPQQPLDEGFPPPIGPSDALGGDVENYAPSADDRALIVCFNCQHFFHRKNIALSWSNRPAAKRRREGKADCLLTTPPTPLLGEYVVECNRFTPRAPQTETP